MSSLDDAVGDRVGQRAFEAAADLDAHLAVFDGDQQQRAVIDLAAAELPLLDDADRVLLDLLGLRGRHDQHRHLAALRLLERARASPRAPTTWSGVNVPVRSVTRAVELRNRRRALLRRSAGTTLAATASSERRQSSEMRRRRRRSRRRIAGDHAVSPRRAPCGTRREEHLSWSRVQASASGAGGAVGAVKSTVGGFAIAASFSTVKFGFTLYPNTMAVRLAGNLRHRGVELLHRLDVAVARHGDAVLGAFELRLQVAEILVGLQLRIALDDHHQARQRARQLALRSLELLQRGRIVGIDRGSGSPWREPR